MSKKYKILVKDKQTDEILEEHLITLEEYTKFIGYKSDKAYLEVDKELIEEYDGFFDKGEEYEL